MIAKSKIARRLMSLLVLAAGVYLALMLALYGMQNSMIYRPSLERMEPSAAGFDGQEIVLPTPDGERLIAWWRPALGDKPVVLYFHGNGGGLRNRAKRYTLLSAQGMGILALSYRGYSGSTGTPSQTHNFLDAERAYSWLVRQGVPPERIALYGESLGTGVAIHLATKQDIRALVLEAPYTSFAAIIRRRFPYYLFPIELLLRDPYRSDQRIGAVRAPVLIMHGVNDRVVPYRLGERLYDQIRPDVHKVLKTFRDGNHQNLYSLGAGEVARAFMADPTP